MNPEQPFLAQIIAEPLNVDLRLIFADWLEEHERVGEAEALRIEAGYWFFTDVELRLRRSGALGDPLTTSPVHRYPEQFRKMLFFLHLLEEEGNATEAKALQAEVDLLRHHVKNHWGKDLSEEIPNEGISVIKLFSWQPSPTRSDLDGASRATIDKVSFSLVDLPRCHRCRKIKGVSRAQEHSGVLRYQWNRPILRGAEWDFPAHSCAPDRREPGIGQFLLERQEKESP